MYVILNQQKPRMMLCCPRISQSIFLRTKKIFLVVYFSVFWSFWWCLILILAFLGRGGEQSFLVSDCNVTVCAQHSCHTDTHMLEHLIWKVTPDGTHNSLAHRWSLVVFRFLSAYPHCLCGSKPVISCKISYFPLKPTHNPSQQIATKIIVWLKLCNAPLAVDCNIANNKGKCFSLQSARWVSVCVCVCLHVNTHLWEKLQWVLF